MRIVWNSDVAGQVIRRMNDADLGMMDCLKDANRAAQALVEANQDGESETLSRLADRLSALTRRMQAAQQQLDDLIGQTRQADESFQDAERRIGAMFDGAQTGASGKTPHQELIDYVKPVAIMADLRLMSGTYTPEWLGRLAGDPKNFMI